MGGCEWEWWEWLCQPSKCCRTSKKSRRGRKVSLVLVHESRGIDDRKGDEGGRDGGGEKGGKERQSKRMGESGEERGQRRKRKGNEEEKKRRYMQLGPHNGVGAEVGKKKMVVKLMYLVASAAPKRYNRGAGRWVGWPVPSLFYRRYP